MDCYREKTTRVTLFDAVKLEKNHLENIRPSIPANTPIQMIAGFLCGGGMPACVLLVLWLLENLTLTGSGLITGGDFGIEGSVVTMALFLLLTLLVLRIRLKEKLYESPSSFSNR